MNDKKHLELRAHLKLRQDVRRKGAVHSVKYNFRDMKRVVLEHIYAERNITHKCVPSYIEFTQSNPIRSIGCKTI